MAEEDKKSDELNVEVKRLLLVIEELTQRAKDIEEKEIPALLEKPNKLIYEAKDQAEKIVADANAEAEKVKASANKLALESKDRVNYLEREANGFVAIAKKSASDSAEIKTVLEKDRVDFDAKKYADESNVAALKKEAEALMSDALILQSEQNTRKINLDSRDSIVIKKEQDLKDETEVLEHKQSATQEKIAELRALEQAHVDEEIEIATSKKENEEILTLVTAEKEEEKRAIVKNQGILDETKKEKAVIEKKQKEVAAQLNSIAREKADVEEKTKTLHEKERMKKLLEREIDIKITTLKKLRGAEKDK